MTTTFESNRKSKVHRYENQPFFRSRKEAKRENAPFFNTVNPANTSFFVQAKLEVGSPDSPAETEADAVAEKVVQMPESSVNAKQEDASQSQTPLADTIARKGSGHTVPVSDKLAGDIRSAQGGGEHLDRSTREFMSSRFGADFSRVKVHTDASSVKMSRELNAHAFTVGNDVFFNRGKYNPTSRNGKRLLAHELTHVVQQKNDKVHTDTIRREEGSVGVRVPPLEVAGMTLGWLGGPSRSLTSGEKQIAREIFMGSILYDEVRIVYTGFIAAPTTLGNYIRIPPSYTLKNEILIHELTHIWQYQNFGGGYISDSLFHQTVGVIAEGDRNAAYTYTIVPGKSFLNYTSEQQAMIVQHYYSKRVRGEEISPDHQALIDEMRRATPSMTFGDRLSESLRWHGPSYPGVNDPNQQGSFRGMEPSVNIPVLEINW